jgi:protocatechuate 3,4-dioxygenase beta subunit
VTSGGATGTATAGTPAAAATGTPGSTAAIPGCVVRPEMTVGPYFVDGQLNLSDLRSEPGDGSVKDGVPLELNVRVLRVSGNACMPLQGATVDVWHCDALGVYSGVSDPGFNTTGQKWLRGYQETNAEGIAAFKTIYPGWYRGRTIHIHFKIRARNAGSSYEFTSQWYMPENINDRVLAAEPYSNKPGRDTTNAADSIYRQGGEQLLLGLQGDLTGYRTTFDIALDFSNAAVGQPDVMGGPGAGGPEVGAPNQPPPKN